jgi:hypothetical protein
VSYKLWLDDLRPSPDDMWIVIRSYSNFVKCIEERGLPEFISFDHDLGEGPTGYDCAKWLVDKECLVEYTVHSANIVGRSNIIGLLDGWKKFKETWQSPADCTCLESRRL